MKETIGKAGLVLGGIGLGILLVGKLYEDIRADYNELVEKYNDLSDFVDSHDFYAKVHSKILRTSENVYKVDFSG